MYLETNTLPIEFILASRRINYLHNILSKKDDELIKRIYQAQKKDPCKGDWCELVQSDMDMVEINMDDNTIRNMSKKVFKAYVKKCVKSAAFQNLRNLQSGHTKVKNIEYSKPSLQPYLCSESFTSEESSLLFNMRANCINGYKMCFSSVNRNDILCKLGCKSEDSINHVFTCHMINTHGGIQGGEYSDIFANIKKQKETVLTFIQRNNIRSTILLSDTAHQGLVLDTASSAYAGEAGEIPGGHSSSILSLCE